MDIDESVTTYIYENNPISFDNGEEVIINATEMAKPFGKKVAEWLELPSTREFLDTLSEVRKSDIDSLVVARPGSSSLCQLDIWMHRSVAIEFAHWLSLEFYLWISDRIIELVSTKKTVIKPVSKIDIEESIYVDDDIII